MSEGTYSARIIAPMIENLFSNIKDFRIQWYVSDITYNNNNFYILIIGLGGRHLLRLMQHDVISKERIQTVLR